MKSKNVDKANKATPALLLERLTGLDLDGVKIYRGDSLPKALRNWTFALFERNMKAMYEATADGYDPVEKASELYSKLSRFVVVSSPDSPSTPVAYSMFRFDHEETRTDSLAAVVYCYELQVEAAFHSRGYGRRLVMLLERLGWVWEMDKVMLTVFSTNTSALRFYARAGYERDEISPDEDDEEGYEIMSKRCGLGLLLVEDRVRDGTDA